MLASCGDTPAPQPPSTPKRELPVPIAAAAPPDHDESRVAVQRAFEALGKDKAFQLAAAVADATSWKQNYHAWKALPESSPHKQLDGPCNEPPDYWYLRRELSKAIRSRFEGDPAFEAFLATRQEGGSFADTRAADALSCVSLKDIIILFALEHPDH